MSNSFHESRAIFLDRRLAMRYEKIGKPGGIWYHKSSLGNSIGAYFNSVCRFYPGRPKIL